VDEVGGDLSQSAEDLLLDSGAIHEESEGALHRRVSQEGVHALHARPLPVHLRPRITLVELKVRDPASEGDGDLALAALFEALEDVVVDPFDSGSVVVLAGLEDGPRSRGRVASALDLERVEMRPVGDVIVGIQFSLQEISRLEVDEPVRARPDGLEVVRRLPRLRALVRLEDVSWNE